jgi:polar amino acid transport system substrate-binding protein
MAVVRNDPSMWRKSAVPLAIAVAALAAGCSSSSGTAPSSSGAASAHGSSLHAMLPASIQQSGVIKIGTEALYPPFESFAADNKTIIGVDPDVAAALGQALGVRVTFTHTAFDGLLTALTAGRFDIIMAAITDTKAREGRYDFVDYFTTGQSIVVKKGNPDGIKGVADLCGKNVAVLTASTQQKLLAQFNTSQCASNPIKVTALPSDKDALLQVQTGRDVADFTQDAVGAYNSHTIGGGNTFEVANSAPMLPTPVGVVFTKASAQLRDAFKAALQEIIANGTYAKILAKYQLSGGAVTTVVVDGATS